MESAGKRKSFSPDRYTQISHYAFRAFLPRSWKKSIDKNKRQKRLSDISGNLSTTQTKNKKKRGLDDQTVDGGNHRLRARGKKLKKKDPLSYATSKNKN